LAIYHLDSKPLSRSGGRSAVAAVAYRGGLSLADERRGMRHDYTRRSGVMWSELVLPDGKVATAAEREALWNAAEGAEKRKDARTAREWEIAIPSELMERQGARLLRTPGVDVVCEFAAELAQRYGVAVDVAIHRPGKDGDQRNWHAHLLATTRQVSRDGAQFVLGAKAHIELGDKDRKKCGLGRGADEITEVRKLWADLANRGLERAGSHERVSHLSLKAQGVERPPTIHLGPVASEMERQGLRSERGDRNRFVGQIIELQAERARLEKVHREVERQRQEELQRQEAEKARREMERRAAEDLARRQADERERQRLEKDRLAKLSSRELEIEIAKIRPPSPRAVVDAMPAVAEIGRAHLRASEERAEALRKRHATESEINVAHRELAEWRETHQVRALLHDKGLASVREVSEMEVWIRKQQKNAQGYEVQEKAAVAAQARAVKRLAELRAQLTLEVEKQQAPTLVRVAELEALRDLARTRERQRLEAEKARSERLVKEGRQLHAQLGAEVEREFRGIQRRAAKLEKRGETMYARAEVYLEEHNRAEPQKPGAVGLVLGRRSRWEAAWQTWEQERRAIAKRVGQLRARVEHVREYARNSFGYPTKGTELAAWRVAKRDPKLVRQVREFQVWDEKRLQAEREQRQQQRDRDRQLGREYGRGGDGGMER